jgi:16S rRNA processing protein RimM
VRPEAEPPDRTAAGSSGRESSGWLRAGRVGRPHGLDGSFYVREPTPRLLEAGTRVHIAGQEWTITRRSGDDRRPIVSLDGCEAREAAEALRGEWLTVARSEAPELDEDEWWEADLVGSLVRDGERQVGTVRRLLGLPSVDVLEVAREDIGPDLLVPLIRDAVRSVDTERKVIQVNLRFLGID